VLLFVCLMACSKKQPPEKVVTGAKEDSTESCTNPYADNMAPMAQDMRAMYEQMVQIRSRIESGELPVVSSSKRIDFINSQPTDSTVLTDEFFMMAGRFQRNFNELAAAEGADIKERYNTVVESCIGCHMHACPGPLKKIRKLSFEAAL
jgi:hypothetical protein